MGLLHHMVQAYRLVLGHIHHNIYLSMSNLLFLLLPSELVRNLCIFFMRVNNMIVQLVHNKIQSVYNMKQPVHNMSNYNLIQSVHNMLKYNMTAQLEHNMIIQQVHKIIININMIMKVNHMIITNLFVLTRSHKVYLLNYLNHLNFS